jgi:hypothetical protein
MNLSSSSSSFKAVFEKLNRPHRVQNASIFVQSQQLIRHCYRVYVRLLCVAAREIFSKLGRGVMLKQVTH